MLAPPSSLMPAWQAFARMKHHTLVLAVLVASLRPHAVSAAATVWPPDQPLPDMATSPACQCDTANRVGWNEYIGRCTKGETTTCRECAQQKKCGELGALVGDGLRAFLGDCRHQAAGQCISADKARMAYPTAIALDENDQLFFADYGNNRVRFLNSAGNLYTVAGTGEVGFSGDHGPGWNARLRFPEGVAIRGIPDPIICDGLTPCHEVFISDSMNQRIRRVTMIGYIHWIIDTIAGTGVRGPGCDVECPALESALNNPRTLVISATKEVYVVDSGNRKIRKISADLQNITDVVGAKADTLAFGFIGFSKIALPGHWSEDVDTLAMDSVYTMAIDNLQNLWWADSTNNRIFMTPTTDVILPRYTGLAGTMMDMYFLHFVSVLETKVSLSQPVIDGLQVWLTRTTPPIITMPPEQSEQETFKVGTAYWRYIRHGRGSWCDVDDCTAGAKAQSTQMGQVSGICFDIANNAYLSDMSSSLVEYLTTSSFRTTGAFLSDGLAYTTTNCPCFQYWTDDKNPEAEKDYDFCLENPNLDADARYQPWHFEVQNQCEGEGPFSQDPKDVPDKDACLQLCFQDASCVAVKVMSDVPKTFECIRYEEVVCHNNKVDQSSGDLYRKFMIPACTEQNYCGTTENIPVPWCYVDRSDDDIVGCPTGVEWGFCNEMGVGVDWEQYEDKEIMGTELRVQKIVRGVGATGYFNMMSETNSYLWKTSESTQLTGTVSFQSLQRWAILKGYVWNSALAWPCANQDPDLYQDGADVGCALTNKDSLRDGSALFAYFMSENASNTLDFIWSDLVSLSNKMWESSHSNVSLTGQDCQDRCGQDLKCSGFVLKRTPSSLSCVMLAEIKEYDIYMIDRDAQITTFGDVANWTYDNFSSVRNLYDGPFAAQSRLLGDWSHLYPDTSLDDHFLGPPLQALSLVLQECKDECMRTTSCDAILYPGCWLMNGTLPLVDSSFYTENDIEVVAYVKLDTKARITRIAGKSGVKTFNEAATLPAKNAMVNRPGPCMVDSHGHLIFADIWNQKIMKITGLQSPCQYDSTDSFDSAAMSEYILAIQAAQSACLQVPFYAELQHAVVENRTAYGVYEKNMCFFDPARQGADPNYLDSPNATYNLMVLCRVCEDNDHFRYGEVQEDNQMCPSRALCRCRARLEAVLSTEVFTECQEPNAYTDDWHLWISAYIHCLWKPPTSDLDFLVQPQRGFLEDMLRDYVPPTPVPTLSVFD